MWEVLFSDICLLESTAINTIFTKIGNSVSITMPNYTRIHFIYFLFKKTTHKMVKSCVFVMNNLVV